MPYTYPIGTTNYVFQDLRDLMAKASPIRSGDQLAGVAARSMAENIAAQCALADLPLKVFLSETVVPYETDEVTRLIIDTHDPAAFAPIAHLTVGGLRDWLLDFSTDNAVLSAVAPGITPEMAAAVAKLMRNQDLVAVARKRQVVTRFRNTLGLSGRFSVRLPTQPPFRRPQRHCRQHRGRAALCRRRRRDRHQPRHR